MNEIQKFVWENPSPVIRLSLILLICLFFSIECFAQHFVEEFDTSEIDTTLWWTPPGNVRPTIMDGHLVLISDSTAKTKSELQSLWLAKYSELIVVAYSSNWASNSGLRRTDTSIGYESFGNNGFHHAILSTNGMLGVLHIEEHSRFPCPPETADQWYYSISSWDSIHNDTLTFHFIWRPDLISLFVYGKSDTGFVAEMSTCHIPDTSLAIRLNSNVLLDDPGGLLLAANDTLWIDRVEVITDINTNVKAIQTNPTTVILHQNYPNPFNPTTRIRYLLPQPSRVVLKIYNVLGEEVRIIEDSIRPAGEHIVAWDGKNARNQLMPNGLYFCRLVSNQFQQTIKMVLLR